MGQVVAAPGKLIRVSFRHHEKSLKVSVTISARISSRTIAVGLGCV